ncbi:uncharacterized protein LOC106085082 [Stomoxys calcitrans]|uniref:uncharacterized protein LOC106085082 n=1 Tax=Stomoxys calcitrans TaxID=35570 RepID=UPI0027E363FD|nr:uncharacterized protein LOC106085082 [Stomoxys calcitrans]
MPKLFLSVIILFLIVTKVECKCGPNELLNHNGICLSPVGLPDCNPSECGEFMKCNQLNECVCLEGFEEYMDYKDYRIKCWKSIPKVSPSSTEKIYTLESVWQQVLPKNQAHKGEDVNTSTAKNSEKQTTVALTKSQDESLNASTSSSPEGHSTTEVSLTNATTENKEASTLGTDSTKPFQTNTTAEDTEPSAFGSENSSKEIFV